MGKINLGRVILGGLVSGVVINIFEGIMNGAILEPQWTEVRKGLGIVGAMSVNQIVAFNIWGFAAGFLIVWLYAAMRPRLGAGPKTGMCAGLVVWATAYALGNAPPVLLHIYPVGLVATAVAVGLVEMMLAGVVGAYFYREE